MHLTMPVLLALLVVAAPLPRKCQRPADQLYRYSARPTITDDILRESTRIALETPEKCLKGELFVEDNGKSFSVGSVTRLFSRICQRSTSPSAAAS